VFGAVLIDGVEYHVVRNIEIDGFPMWTITDKTHDLVATADGKWDIASLTEADFI
jgi:hypothetical protein